MATNYYETLKKKFQEKRKAEPEPQFFDGAFLPHVTTGRTLLGVGWDEYDIITMGKDLWTRLQMAALLRGAKEVGWEKLLNAIEARQSTGVTEAAREFRKELGLTGNSMVEINLISAAGTSGCEFDWHRVTYQTDTDMQGTADGCPLVNAAREMGVADFEEMKEVSLWCDTYDNFETRATNPDCMFTHTHCMGRGDKLCRFWIDFREVQKPGEDWYQAMKRNLADKLVEDPKLEDYYGPGYWVPRKVEGWDKKKLMKIGVDIQRRITVATTVIMADMIGWDKWINGMQEIEIPKLQTYARNNGVKYGVTGGTAIDASVLMHLNMMGAGYDDHQLVSWTDKRVEGVARTCPLVESAKELHMEDSLKGDMCLWCSACANAAVKANNKDLNCTFTHCIGKGDKLCRWVIE